VAEAKTTLRLRVAPGAAPSGVVGRYGDAWKVRVASTPERGRANADLVKILAAALAVPERSVELVSGHASRDKTVTLHGLHAEEAERRLERAR
jgi:uncharacterized protein (TIGR00251 family)